MSYHRFDILIELHW